ncbi:S-layer homology domain-containing protein [Lawsonibacter sp. JLR.KK007]|uniref:S-layer homology domain-containing protein n=1 Tax=Lawsonibacter sp. JLR.KK007 TaxID=3114293 RepID=UPI002FEEBC96
MRNLKRALSLTLASVMLLGMMVVGSSAAGYPDVAEDDNVEAIEVVQSVGVMVGDENGNFRPGDSVSRAEMAVVMGKLLNLDYNYYEAVCPFTDVAGVYDWARGWVGAAAANGIVSGRGDGVYDPGATVTAVEAASMMMRALGYFKYQSDYANGFEVSTVLQGNNIGIFDGVGSSASEPMTRNQVAQMVLNALQSGMVQADGNTLNYFDSNGQVIATSGKVNYVYVTSNQSYARAISEVRATSMGSTNDSPIVELGEQLYNGSLKLNERSTDDFYRPTRTWEFESKTIGSYVKKELLKAEYTEKVTGRMLYDLLTRDVIDNYEFDIAIDGVETSTTGARDILKDSDNHNSYFTTDSLVRANTDGVGRTGKGVLTQVFVDDSKDVERVYVAVINTYLAIAEKDYDSKRDEVTLKGYNMDNKGAPASPIYIKDEDLDETKIVVDGEDFAIEDVKKDDKFLITVADGRVQSMVTPEVLSEVTLRSFKKDNWVNADGTQYDHADTARYDVEVLDAYDDVNMKDVTYNIVLDAYGYLIGLELNEKANQYVFVTGTDAGESNLYAKNANVNVIFLDGTMDTVVVNTKDSKVDWAAGGRNLSQVNTWCTYTKNANDVYTLKEVGINSESTDPTYLANHPKKVAQSAMDADPNTFDINTKNVSLDGSRVAHKSVGDMGDFTRVYGNDDTVYINAKMERVTVKDGNKPMFIVDDVDSVTTGVKNVDFTVNNYSVPVDPDNTAVGGTDPHPENNYDEHAKNEAYILYDKDGYIISVVLLAADDKGTSAQYAYITSGVQREDYLGNDEWEWHRDAIINGEKVDLVEVDDQSAYLNTGVESGKWYEVRFDAKGHVSGLKPNAKVNPADTHNRVVNSTYIDFDFGWDRFVNDVDEVVNAVNGNSFDPDDKGPAGNGPIAAYNYETSKTVLLYADYYCGASGVQNHGASGSRADLSFKNGTLYTNTAQTEGFSVAPTVKVVLALAAKNHGDKFDSVEEVGTGYDALKDALNRLDSDKSSFCGYLGAVIEDGAATSIILDDRSGAARPDYEAVKPMTVTVNKVDANGASIAPSETITWYGASPLTATAVSGYTQSTANWAVSNFRENTTATVTYVYTKDGGETKKVMVQYRAGSSSGTVVGYDVIDAEIMSVIDESSATSPIKVAYDANTTLNADYEIAGNTSHPITSSTETIDVVVQWKMVDLKLAAGIIHTTGDLTVAWAADTSKGLVAGAATNIPANDDDALKVPHGVELTIAGNNVGKYTSTGADATKMTLVADKEVKSTDFGYYKVSLGAVPTLTDWTVTQAIADANDDGDVFVKGGVATNVVINLSLTPDTDQTIAQNQAVNAAVAGTGMTKGTETGLPAGGTDAAGTTFAAGTAVNGSVTVSANITADGTITITLNIA